MPKKPQILSQKQKDLIVRAKQVEVSQLSRQQPALVAQAIKLAPPTPKKRAQEIRWARNSVTQLLHSPILSEATTGQQLASATGKLKDLVHRSARKRALARSTSVGLRPVSRGEARRQAVIIGRKLDGLRQTLLEQRALRVQANTPALRHALATRLTVTQATIASLQYRLSLLQRGKSVITHKAIPAQHLHNKLPELRLPRAFALPDRSKVTPFIRLIGTARPRKEGEAEDCYRGVIKAYTKRALLRYVSKAPNGIGTVAAVQEALTHDAPAIEEAANSCAVPADSLSTVMDAPLEDAALDVEEAVIDFPPAPSEFVRKGWVASGKEEAQKAVGQAQEEELALQAEGIDPLDEIEAGAAVEKPFYETQEFLWAAGAGVVLLLLLRR